MAVNLNPAFKALRKSLPGAVVDCTWARVTGSTYDPVTGSMVNTTATETFSAIKGEYRTFERLAGIQAGDVRLIVIATIDKPRIGDVITIGSDSFDVINLGDYAGIAYDIQLRRK